MLAESRFASSELTDDLEGIFLGTRAREDELALET